MANIALHKQIEEKWTNKGEATDGNVTKYDDNKTGFACTEWPSTLTVDLEKSYDLHTIRFLLWDNLGGGRTQRALRRYKYRLLTSIDHKNWIVHYDTGDSGFNGWQEFKFPHKISARFIRVHALQNSANKFFHIVQIEAYDSLPPPLDVDCINKITLLTEDQEVEIKDGMPFSTRLKALLNSLTKEIEKLRTMLAPNILNPILNIINDLRVRLKDVESIEKSMDSIRREIINPVNKELKKASKLGKFSKWGFWVGIIGFIVAIASIFINLNLSRERDIRDKEIYEWFDEFKQRNE